MNKDLLFIDAGKDEAWAKWQHFPTGVTVADWPKTVLGVPFQDEPSPPDDWMR